MWDAPKTEEGLQQVLSRLAEAREAGDSAEIGNGLLTLGFLVKWVRSDNHVPPFDRAHELAVEALEHFRRAGHVQGQILALEAASQLADRPVRDAMLEEAAELAQSTGDEKDVVFVLAAQARHMAISNAAAAAELHHQAAEIYRRLGDARGLGRCLFALAIGPGLDAEKRGYAMEAAETFRSIGDFEEAARMTMVALLNLEDLEAAEREAIARIGLQDAVTAEHASLEELCSTRLAEFLEAQGRAEEAKPHRERAMALRDPHEMTPEEEWEEKVMGAQMLLDLAEKRGETETIARFQEELRRLDEEGPLGFDEA